MAATLRAHRVQVHLVSASESLLHTRLLRKFAPHGIVIDEELLAQDASALMQAIRRDPFLQHAQLIVSRYERLFRSHSGSTQLDSLLPLLQPLGKAELSLLEKLGPTCEVEFGFDEVPPHLLLKLLVPRSVATQLECARGDEKLTWTVGWNAGAEAELRIGGAARLVGHEQALDWLFAGEETRVVAIQRPETDPLRGSDVLPLVEARVSETRPLCPPPPVLQVEETFQKTASIPPHSSMRPFAISSKPERRSVSPLAARRALLVPMGVAAAALIGLSFLQFAKTTEEDGSPSIDDKVVVHSAVSPRELEAREVETPEPSAAELDEQKGTESVEAEPLAQAKDKPFSVFGVSSQVLEQTCEEVLGEWDVPKGNPAALAVMYFRQAQKHLMGGRNEQAHRLLCQSASLVSGGPGALELGRYYLGRRIYGPAQDALEAVLRNNESNVEGRLLLADLFHQMGQVEEASRTLVQAIGVELTETSKLKAVSRKYLADAKAALRHVDLPLAERYVRRAHALDMENEEAIRLLVQLFEKRGEQQAAEKLQRWFDTQRDQD